MATRKELAIYSGIGLSILALALAAYFCRENFFPPPPEITATPSLVSRFLLHTPTEVILPTSTVTPTPSPVATNFVLYQDGVGHVIPPHITPDPNMPDTCRAWYPRNKLYPKGWRSETTTDNCLGFNIHLVEDAGGGVYDLIAQGPTASP